MATYKVFISQPMRNRTNEEIEEESIKLLSEADIVIFAKGWEEARGCIIEHECCEKYGKHLIELI